MEIVLLIATLIGGAAALWFFWDKIAGWWRQRRRKNVGEPSHELPDKIHPILSNVGTAAIQPVTPEIGAPIPSPTQKSFSEFELKQPGDIYLDQYFDQLKKLKDRFFEREQLRKDTNGKMIVFRGVVRDVTRKADKVQIGLKRIDDPLSEIVFADLDTSNEAGAFSLRKHDVIEVRGAVDTSMHSFTSITVTAFKRSANSSD